MLLTVTAAMPVSGQGSGEGGRSARRIQRASLNRILFLREAFRGGLVRPYNDSGPGGSAAPAHSGCRGHWGTSEPSGRGLPREH